MSNITALWWQQCSVFKAFDRHDFGHTPGTPRGYPNTPLLLET